MKKITHVFQPGRGTGNFAKVLEGVVKKSQRPIKVTVEEHKPPKTNPQNSYFHGVVVPTVARVMGKDTPVIRESFKLAFLPQQPSALDPEKWYPKSLADLTREEYSEFIDECIAWAAGEGIIIPEPRHSPDDLPW